MSAIDDQAWAQVLSGIRQSNPAAYAALKDEPPQLMFHPWPTIGVVATDKGLVASWLRGSTFVVRRYQNLEALLDDHQLSHPRFVVSAEGMAGCGLYADLLVARERDPNITLKRVRPSERATSPDHRYVAQELNANLQAQIDHGLEAPCPLDLLDRDVVRAMSLCVWAG